jgi:DNA-binding NarL/FixJ family response regulator
MNEGNNIGVAVIDDEPAVCSALRYVINHTEGLRCVLTASQASKAIAEMVWKKPDILLLDLHLPSRNGPEWIPEIKEKLPALSIIMLTSEEDIFWIRQSLQAGADGYILKKHAQDSLLQSIRTTLRGGSILSPEVARRLIDEERRQYQSPPLLRKLSKTERIVLKLMAEGASYKEIAVQLGISVETVRTHSRRIFKKLQVHSRTEAVLLFINAGEVV